MQTKSAQTLEARIRVLLWLFIIGLILAGATAIPLVSEINWLAHATGADTPPGIAHPTWMQTWLATVQLGVSQSDVKYPFLSYGTDWLAFGHFAIAVAFIGPLRDPVKNVWVVEFGMIASALVIPFAMIMGAERGIPFGWRLIDCSFGVFGFLALALCRKLIKELEAKQAATSKTISGES